MSRHNEQQIVADLEEEEDPLAELGLTAMQKQELKDAFSLLDRDGSGKVEPQELKTVMNALG